MNIFVNYIFYKRIKIALLLFIFYLFKIMNIFVNYIFYKRIKIALLLFIFYLFKIMNIFVNYRLGSVNLEKTF